MLAAAGTPPDWHKCHPFTPLLGACTDVALIRAFLQFPTGFGYMPHATLASQFAVDWACLFPEEAALPLLRDALPAALQKPSYGPLLKTPPREIAEAIACFRTPEAAAILAPYFGHAVLGPIVAAYFKDAPELQGALQQQAKGKSRAAEAAARLLETAKAKRPRGPTAATREVPAILRERPWRPRKGDKPVVLRLAIPAGAEERVELTDAERKATFDARGIPIRDMTAKELGDWREAVKKNEYAHADFDPDWHQGAQIYLRVPEEEGLRAWNDAGATLLRDEMAYLARYGVAAIPGFLKRDWVGWLNYTEVGDDPMGIMHHIVSPRLAPQMARVMARRKKFRREGQAWLLRHPAVAAQGLIPDAFGPPGQARDDAAQALLFLAAKGATETLREGARAYGAAARAALDALLARDPLAIEVKPPKLPDFLRPDDLPPVLTRSGARLPDDAMDALVELASVAPLDPPYAGVTAARDALDATSLAAFARELLEQWLLAGAHGRFEWMLFASAHFPGDDATRRVATLARDWARRDREKARRACAALAAIGSDLALLHLGHVAQTSRFEDLRKDARGLLDEAAAARGLSRDALEDRIVPDLDLDTGGTLHLSFGPRDFTVALDERLRPRVRDASGAVLPSLPRAVKTDDAAKAKAARARFDLLKRDASHVADRQLRRLEAAMVAGRDWSWEDFQARVATHPLLLPLVRRLVWEATTAKGTRLLRVAEDGTLAGQDDTLVAPPAGARVRIAHPARMTERARAAWARILGDYELLQPFEQLGRAVLLPTAEERAARRVERTAGVRAAAKKVLGTLEARGWRRDDRGHVSAYLRPVRTAAFEVCLPITPGIPMDDVGDAPEQTIGALELRGAGAEDATFGSLDVVDFSEALRDALTLGG